MPRESEQLADGIVRQTVPLRPHAVQRRANDLCLSHEAAICHYGLQEVPPDFKDQLHEVLPRLQCDIAQAEN